MASIGRERIDSGNNSNTEHDMLEKTKSSNVKILQVATHKLHR